MISVKATQNASAQWQGDCKSTLDYPQNEVSYAMLDPRTAPAPILLQ